MRTLIIIPTYVEAENIADVLRKVRAAAPHAHILVVDDASPDGTADIARRTNDEVGHIGVLERPGKGGLGGAYRAGFQYAFARGFEIVVQMDADLSHPPDRLPALLAEVEGGADIAIGSRYVKGGATANWPLVRRLLSRSANLYATLLLGLGINDATAGFRAYRADVLEIVEASATKATGYGFQLELSYRAHRLGARIVEIPITFNDRVLGVSKMSWHIIGEAMSLVAWWAVRDRILRRSGPIARPPQLGAAPDGDGARPSTAGDTDDGNGGRGAVVDGAGAGSTDPDVEPAAN